MPRFTFEGKGHPIPGLALPAVGSDDKMIPATLTFAENAEFPVAAYRDLGFTHFEAWAVGAAGGRGGDPAAGIRSGVGQEKRPVVQSVWDLRREEISLEDYVSQRKKYNDPPDTRYPASNGPLYYDYTVPPQMNRVVQAWSKPVFEPGPGCWITDVVPANIHPTYMHWRELMDRYNLPMTVWSPVKTAATPYGGPQSWFGWTEWTFSQVSAIQLFDRFNSGRLMTFRTINQAVLDPNSNAGFGGGGGGGGFQKVSGALADLPDAVPIVVGKAGADGALGQVFKHGQAGLNRADFAYKWGIPSTWPENRIAEIQNYLEDYTWLITDTTKATTFGNPTKGADGGASSFGDVLRASGGVGGEPGIKWAPDISKFIPNGHGGAGGIGGRLAPGGGAPGSTLHGVSGSDGTWLPVSGIGQGGGGGRGSRTDTASRTTTHYEASAGGQGSFSYEDTSVYGQRQARQTWSYLGIKPQYTSNPDGTYNTIITQTPVSTSQLVIPGSGGGARPQSNLKAGSRAPGYSPHGVVIIRLVAISE